MIDMTSFLHSKNKNKTTTFPSLAPSRRARLEVPKAAHLPTIVVHQRGRIFGHTQCNKLPIGKGWDPTRFLWVIGLMAVGFGSWLTQHKPKSPAWAGNYHDGLADTWAESTKRHAFPWWVWFSCSQCHPAMFFEPVSLLAGAKDSIQQFQRHVPRPLLHF